MRCHHVFLSLFVILLCSCAVSNDPRQGGLFGGLHGIYSGEYENRIQQRQSELNRQKSYSQDLGKTSESLTREEEAQRSRLRIEQDKLSRMETDLSKLEADIKNLSTESAARKHEVSQLQQRLENQRKALKSQQVAIDELDRSGGITTDPERYRILVRERDRLAEEYRHLIGYYRALSDAAE